MIVALAAKLHGIEEAAAKPSEKYHLAHTRLSAAGPAESEYDTLFDKANATAYLRGIGAQKLIETKVRRTEYTHLYMSGAHAARKMISVYVS